MNDKDLKEGSKSARPGVRVIKSDDDLTPAAVAALHRRSHAELQRLADEANRRG
ncbi:MAG: hypothetical protein AAGD35_10250 [Actinomycetota bacterium]